MMTMIRKAALVLLVCGFVQAGYATAGSELMEGNDFKEALSITERTLMEPIDYDYNELSADLASMTVRNLNEQAVALEALWQDRRVVLVFLRHFG